MTYMLNLEDKAIIDLGFEIREYDYIVNNQIYYQIFQRK